MSAAAIAARKASGHARRADIKEFTPMIIIGVVVAIAALWFFNQDSESSGDAGAAPRSTTQSPQVTQADPVADLMQGFVTDDNHPVAVMLDGVYDDAGFDIPLGATDYNVVQYAMSTCDASPPPPGDWEPWGDLDPAVPANVVDLFATIVRLHAAGTIC